jgi:hypothetical protein
VFYFIPEKEKKEIDTQRIITNEIVKEKRTSTMYKVDDD